MENMNLYKKISYLIINGRKKQDIKIPLMNLVNLIYFIINGRKKQDIKTLLKV